MTNFFESKQGEKAEAEAKKEEPKIRNIVDRAGLEEANKALKSAGFDSGFGVGGDQKVDAGTIPVQYTREVIGAWQIDHGVKGQDYMIQLIPRRKVRADVREVLRAIITVISRLIPEDVQVYINPPNEGLDIDFYTIRLEAVMRRPGADKMVRKRIPAELGKITYAS